MLYSCTHMAKLAVKRINCHLSHILGDIVGKRFRLLRSMLPFRGLSVMFVHRGQTAEDIDTVSFTHDSLVSLSDRFKIWLGQTLASQILPQCDQPRPG